MIRIGLIGYGEAGYLLTSDMNKSLVELFAFDVIAKEESERSAKIKENASANFVKLVDSLEELADRSQIILCLTSANSALPIAREIVPFLKEGQIYSDLNSTSPATKKEIGGVLRESKANFVEAAIMAAVPAHRTKVPIYVCGAQGRQMADMLNGIGMNIEYLSENLGAASATKMLKSVLFKGFIALLTETVFATDQYDITEDVLQALKSILFVEMTYEECCNYFVGTMATHSERLGYEMEEVLLTLESMGENSIMTKATLEKMRWITSQGYNNEFALRPDGYEPILEYKRKLDETKI